MDITRILKLSSFIWILTSCDAEHMKDYYVKNELDSTITFLYTAQGVPDSVIIKKDEEKLIYNYIYVFGTVGVDDDRENDPVMDFKLKYDTITKIIEENAWSYEETGKYHAIYRLKVDSELIK